VNLASAAGAALAVEPDLDLATLFAELIEGGAFAGLSGSPIFKSDIEIVEDRRL
jgi:hypothetical protein